MPEIGYNAFLIALLTAAISLGLNGLLVIWLSRSMKQVNCRFTGIGRQLHDLRYDWDMNRQRIDNDIDTVLRQCDLDMDFVKNDILRLRDELNEGMCELAEAVIRIEEYMNHALNRDHLSDFASKSALYTVRTDLEKLNAEVLRIRNRHEVRVASEAERQLHEIQIERRSSHLHEAVTADVALTMLKQRRRVVSSSGAVGDSSNETVEVNVSTISDSMN